MIQNQELFMWNQNGKLIKMSEIKLTFASMVLVNVLKIP